MGPSSSPRSSFRSKSLQALELAGAKSLRDAIITDRQDLDRRLEHCEDQHCTVSGALLGMPWQCRRSIPGMRQSHVACQTAGLMLIYLI